MVVLRSRHVLVQADLVEIKMVLDRLKSPVVLSTTVE